MGRSKLLTVGSPLTGVAGVVAAVGAGAKVVAVATGAAVTGAEAGVGAGALADVSAAMAAAAIGAAAGAELGALWPLQGPAGLGPFELGVWTAAQWLGQSPPGLLAAAVTAHLFCITVALVGALVAMWTCGPLPAASLVGESRR